MTSESAGGHGLRARSSTHPLINPAGAAVIPARGSSEHCGMEAGGPAPGGVGWWRGWGGHDSCSDPVLPTPRRQQAPTEPGTRTLRPCLSFPTRERAPNVSGTPIPRSALPQSLEPARGACQDPHPRRNS